MSYETVTARLTIPQTKALLYWVGSDTTGRHPERDEAIAILRKALADAELTEIDGFAEGDRVLHVSPIPQTPVWEPDIDPDSIDQTPRPGTIVNVFPGGGCLVRLDAGYSTSTHIRNLTKEQS